MTAYLVLFSVAVLLALLIHGRWSPSILFASWASGYYLLGMVTEKVFLSSFSNSALVTLIVLLLVSAALERSSMLDRLSAFVVRGGEMQAVLRLSSISVVISAFVNNTAVVAAFLGMVSKQTRVAPSRLLIPLSYASILGGVVTLVGTSTNLVVNSFAVQAGLAPLGMFQFAWVGIPIAVSCVLVMAVTARWLPSHATDAAATAQGYFLEARLLPESPMVGRTIEANRLRSLNGLFLVEIVRGGRLISPVGPGEILEPDDVLIFSGETAKLHELKRFEGLQVFGHHADALLNSNLVEVVISSQSELANKTLKGVDFRTMFDAAVVGIRRGDRQLTGQLGRIELRVGDSLLLAAGPDFAHHRNLDRNFHVLSATPVRPRLSARQSAMVLGGFACVIALSALEWVPLLNGLLVLLALLLATGILELAELRRRFPFDLLVTIGSALVMAEVLDRSGAAALIANGMRSAFAGYGVMGAFIGIYLITVVLTEILTNNAAAALAFPIALSTAKAFGVDPLPFVMLVAYGASAGFLIPFGYQTHLMVYSPGRYRVRDFLRAGLPVSLTYAAVTLTLVPVFFPFTTR
jgi:di/tricarboxylate transporter